MSSDAAKVREFTEGATGRKCPERPVPLDRANVLFIIRMIFSELDELACTVSANETERDNLLAEALAARDRCHEYADGSEPPSIADQADALVDSWYYSLNCAAKHGINLSRVFDVVHQANMDKRDPVTGEFIRRADGKVIKPAGWQAPDIDAEIARQQSEGAW